jgi:hypothetical protein
VEVGEDDIARRFPWYSQLIHEKLGSCHIAKRTARVMAFRVSVPLVMRSPELTARRRGANGRARTAASRTAASVASAGRRRRPPSPSSACSTSLARPGKGSGLHALHKKEGEKS